MVALVYDCDREIAEAVERLRANGATWVEIDNAIFRAMRNVEAIRKSERYDEWIASLEDTTT